MGFGTEEGVKVIPGRGDCGSQDTEISIHCVYMGGVGALWGVGAGQWWLRRRRVGKVSCGLPEEALDAKLRNLC